MDQQGPVGPPVGGPVGPRRRIVDLGLAVDRGAPVPLPDQIERALRERVGRGELKPGDPLPSTRALAADLELSRGVVVEAYDRLVRQGLLVARQGAAVRVSDAAGAAATGEVAAAARSEHAAAAADAGRRGGREAAPQAGSAPVVDPAALPPDARSHSWATGNPWRWALHPATTPIGTLDRRAWGAAQRAALREGTEAQVAVMRPAGDPGLRVALAAQLSRSRGVVTDPAHLAITSGVTDAIRGLAPILAARGGRVGVEEPGFVLHRSTLLGSGLELVPIPADDGGLRVDALEAAGDLAAVLLTPAHQMPLGVPLAPDRRAALAGWARRTGALLLEDDYDGELRYDRRGVRSLHALAPDRVVYLGTTAKVLSYAVRVGWMVTPPELSAEAHGWRLTVGATPSTLEQLALAELVRTGAFDRGVARLRRRCAAQRAALLEALAQAAPDLEPTGVAAGLHFGVRVPGVSAAAIVTAAAQRDVELFAADTDADTGDGGGPGAIMIVGFGAVAPAAASLVAAELATIVAAAREAGGAIEVPAS